MSEQEVLVVVSKVKNYIREQSDMNTAGSVAPKISEIIRGLCDRAIESARKDGRKTVMEKDFA
jgi:histone H3/H4